MATIASLDVRIGARTEELARGLQHAEGLVSATFRRITSIAGSLPVVLGGLSAGAGLVAASKRAIALASDLEQARMAFTTMLGSAKEADQFLRQMADFAAKTPFQFEDVRNAAQRFLAFGFEASKVIPILTAVGNAAAALGGSAELINRITLALGQMRAKGKISGEEMRQLAEAGIPAWEMLAKTIGVSIPEAMKMAERGAIDVGTALDGFINQMNERFPGMMEKQAETLAGMWSTIKDEVSLSLTILGEKIIRTFNLKQTLAQLRASLGEFREVLEKQGLEAALAKALGADMARSLMSLFETLRAQTLPLLASIGKKLLEVATTAAPYLLDALNQLLSALPKIAEFFARMPAYAKVGFTFLAKEMTAFAATAHQMVLSLLTALDSLPFVDVGKEIEDLRSKYGALTVAGAEAAAEHKNALKELAALIEAQQNKTVKVAETLPAVAEAATESASTSIIRITTALGEQISGQLKGGFGRGGAEGAREVQRHITSLQEYAAAHPITLRVRYVTEGQPAGLPVAMPAG